MKQKLGHKKPFKINLLWALDRRSGSICLVVATKQVLA
jgi:hypothetical protein